MALPAAARGIATAVADGVAAVRAADASGFTDVLVRLGKADPQRVSLVLGGVVRTLLEERHPDGMDGEDVRTVLERCVRSAAAWDPAVDPQALLVVLTGALGMSDPEEQPVLPPDVVARHALLLGTELLGPRPVAPYVTASLAELARAETVEMP